MTAADDPRPAGEAAGHRQRPNGSYRCCPHCADDAIHDVPTDGHDLPCTLCLRAPRPAASGGATDGERWGVTSHPAIEARFQRDIAEINAAEGRHAPPLPASGGATDGEREALVPTNAQLADEAKSLDARTVVRNWLDRHVGQPPFAWSGRRREWLDWASANFLADPEIAAHLLMTAAPVASQADGELWAK